MGRVESKGDDKVNIIGIIMLMSIFFIFTGFFLSLLCYFNDRLYCLTRGIDYEKTKIVEYGYATVYFTESEEDQE